MQDYKLAYRILANIYQNQAFASLELTKSLDEANNRDFVTKLVYGVLEKNTELDYYINQLTTKKPKNSIAVLLKMGMYCIKYMDSLPDYAVVSKMVTLCSVINKQELKGFVNATLKKFCTWGGVIPNDPKEALSISTSTPLWLVEEYIKQYGIERTTEFLQPSTYVYEHIRVNSRTYSMKELLEVMTEFRLKYDESVEGAIYTKYKKIMKELYDKGKITVQSRTSMDCCKALSPKDGDEILDVCSAPGGKSVYLSELAKVHITSCDVYPHRIDLIESYVKRMNAENIDIKLNDATIFNSQFENKFDKVLCDVPCSGLGVVNKKPDIYLGLTMSNIIDLSEIQRKILDTSKAYVKVGGTLVYSTCTILKQENVEVVEDFIANNNNFVLKDSIQYLPDGKGQDGFYIAKMERIK